MFVKMFNFETFKKNTQILKRMKGGKLTKTPSSFESTKNKTVAQKNRRPSTLKKTAPRLADDSIEVLPWTLAILLSTIQAQPQRSKP